MAVCWRRKRKRDPDNLIPEFLDNYIDFFQLFFNEDAAEYPAVKVRLEQRLVDMEEGPLSSPFNLFTRSVIHFQWAAINVKMGNNLDAGLEFRRSFLESQECRQKFPAFGPALMLSGAMKVVASTIPDGYKWLSNLLGIRGSVREGMGELDQFLGLDDEWSALFRDEANFYYLYFSFISSTSMNRFLRISGSITWMCRTIISMRICMPIFVSMISSRRWPSGSSREGAGRRVTWICPFGTWRWVMLALNHLEPGTPIYLERFLRRFRGRFYVKDALEKLSWYYYEKGDQDAGGFVAGGGDQAWHGGIGCGPAGTEGGPEWCLAG